MVVRIEDMDFMNKFCTSDSKYFYKKNDRNLIMGRERVGAVLENCEEFSQRSLKYKNFLIPWFFVKEELSEETNSMYFI